ncbi:acyltransferase family protein [Pararhizobium arenae]|uniref:acyltransferase family protein n=1 Tax=Pararhizobium arenae TaxID=1856850 RepID=UPI00094B488F|nr:acyltransferase [Pararhizobium arenae]
MASSEASRQAGTGTTVRPVRFLALDSWRGICALLVAVMHFPAAGPISDSPFIRNAYLFVDYFFVLSGFVIAHGYSQRIATGTDYFRFALLRLGRIYPLHVAVLALFLGFELLRWAVPALRGDAAAPFSEGMTIAELFSSLALLNGVGFDTRLVWNSPSWSISAEMWTYLFFGFAVLVLGRRHWLAFIPAIFVGMISIWSLSPLYMDTTWQLGLIRCVYGFSLGALLYRFAGGYLVAFHQGRPDRPAALATVLEVAALALVVLFVTFAGKGPASVFAPWVFAIAICIFGREAGHVSRALKATPFLWLGTLSYAIYMVHIFVQSRLINGGSLAGKFTGLPIVGDCTMGGEAAYGFGPLGGAFGTVMMLVMALAVIVAAAVAHFLVEKPFIALSKAAAQRVGSREMQNGRKPKPASV